MLKRYLAIGGLLALSCGAQANLIERDWLAAGDKSLTYVSELNIEILDVSLTANIGHVAASKELEVGGLYYGFRFMNKAEITTVIDSYFGGMDSQFQLLGSDASLQMSNFLGLVNATSSGLTFNTCEYALGCELGGPRDMGNYLKNSQRWLFTPDLILMVDQLENATQLLIRDVPVTVPEPAGVLLFGFGLMMVAGLRYRQTK